MDERRRFAHDFLTAQWLIVSSPSSETDVLQLAEQVRRATVSDVKRLRELETENTQLKRMYADSALENAAIKDVLHRKL